MFGESWARTDAQDFVKSCYDRDALLETLLGYSLSWLDAALIGVVGKGKVTVQRSAGAWSSASPNILGSNAALQQSLQRGEPSLETPGALGVDALMRLAPSAQPEALLVLPLMLGGRPVVALVGCPTPGPVDLSIFDDLVVLAQLVALQLEEIILRAKSGELPPQDKRIPPPPSPKRSPQAPIALSEGDDLLGFSSASEPFPESLKGLPAAEPAGPAIVSLFSSQPASKTFNGVSQAVAPSSRSASAGDDESEAQAVVAKSALQALPLSPFEDGAAAAQRAAHSAAPGPALRAKLQQSLQRADVGSTQELAAPNPNPEFSRDETSGVSIIPPQDISGYDHASKRTLMGGFSVADVLRARKEAERLETEQRAKLRQTLNGGFSPVQVAQPEPVAPQVPAAKILKPTRRRDESEAREELGRAPSRATMPSTPASSAPQASAPSVTRPLASPMTQPMAMLEVAAPQPALSAESTLELEPPQVRATPAPVALIQPLDIDPSHVEPLEPEPSPAPRARVISQHAHQSPLSLEALAAKLDQRDGRQVAEALAALLERDGGAESILRIFPGRLVVDRYQHTIETMPSVEEHGPLLAAAAAAPASLDALIEPLISATSLDKRFYATLLLTKRSPARLFVALRERLFDRDMQTRQLARSILANARGEDGFERDVLAPLRAQLAQGDDEYRVENAAEFLGQAHDKGSVEVLIELLEQHKGRAQQSLLLALQRITLQPLEPVAFSWRVWWKMGQREERRDWLLRALNASSESIRDLAGHQLQRLPGLSLHYNSRQPPAMRIRAQNQFKQWLEQNPELASRL